jgi:hypothetical protein
MTICAHASILGSGLTIRWPCGGGVRPDLDGGQWVEFGSFLDSLITRRPFSDGTSEMCRCGCLRERPEIVAMSNLFVGQMKSEGC